MNDKERTEHKNQTVKIARLQFDVINLKSQKAALLAACKPFTQIKGIDRHGRIVNEYPEAGTLDFRLSVEEFKTLQSAIEQAGESGE